MAEAPAAPAPYTPMPAAAPPAPAAPPMASAMPMAAPPAPMPSTMAEGGETASKSSVKDFFSDVDILDVTISAFIVGAVLYSVHYYKFMMMIEKTGYADLNGRIQKVES